MLLLEEEQALAEAIQSARVVQEFLWGKPNDSWGLEEWKRMFRKRVVKLEEVQRDNPHAEVELKKRLLQLAALSIALLGVIEHCGVPWEAAPGSPPSNLPQYADPFEDYPQYADPFED
jgi:ABC-type transport system substrate-binding protein